LTKICRKVPHENIHGEASVLENFPKKKKIATFPGERKKKKRVLKLPHFEEEKNRF
jgi:hypothetical protein